MSARSPILESCIETLTHGLEHYIRSDTAKDRKFAILHIDQAIELLLKEKVRSLGVSIYKRDGKTTISLQEAYDVLEQKKCAIKEKPNLEMLHDERNLIQHKYSNPDETTAKFHIENGLAFFERFFYEDFDIRIENVIPQEILDSPKLGFTTEETKVNKLFKSAEDSIKGDLSSTVLLLFNVSEILLREKLESINIDTSKKSVTEIFSLSAKNKLLLKDELVKLDKLRMFRNKVVHQEFIPTSKECQDMLVFIRALIKRLK